MKTNLTNLLKTMLPVALGLFCYMQSYAQAPKERAKPAESEMDLSSSMDVVINSLQKLSAKEHEGEIQGLVTELEKLSASVDSKSGAPHFQNLSNKSEKKESKASGEKAKTGKAAKLSSEEITSSLNTAISKLESYKDESLKGIISNMKDLRDKYSESSYQDMRNKLSKDKN